MATKASIYYIITPTTALFYILYKYILQRMQNLIIIIMYGCSHLQLDPEPTIHCIYNYDII